MSDLEAQAAATPLDRAVWQIERGILWQRNVNSAGGIQITTDVLLGVLRQAAGDEALEGFYPEALDDVLAKARELQAAEAVGNEK